MLIAVLAFICGFIAIPLVNSVSLVVFFFALINCAYSVFYRAEGVVCRFCRRKESADLPQLYLCLTVGLPIGTLLVMHSINLPFSARRPAPHCRWLVFSSSFSAPRRPLPR